MVKVKRQCANRSCALASLQIEVEESVTTCIQCGGGLVLDSFEQLVSDMMQGRRPRG